MLNFRGVPENRALEKASPMDDKTPWVFRVFSPLVLRGVKGWIFIDFQPWGVWVVGLGWVGLGCWFKHTYIGVSKNRGTHPLIMENPIKMDDLGVPLFFETHICLSKICLIFCEKKLYQHRP